MRGTKEYIVEISCARKARGWCWRVKCVFMHQSQGWRLWHPLNLKLTSPSALCMDLKLTCHLFFALMKRWSNASMEMTCLFFSTEPSRPFHDFISSLRTTTLHWIFPRLTVLTVHNGSWLIGSDQSALLDWAWESFRTMVANDWGNNDRCM